MTVLVQENFQEVALQVDNKSILNLIENFSEHFEEYWLLSIIEQIFW